MSGARSPLRTGTYAVLAMGLLLSAAVGVLVTGRYHVLPQRLWATTVIIGSVTLVMVLFWRSVAVAKERFRPVAGAFAAGLSLLLGLFVAFSVQMLAAALADEQPIQGLLQAIPLSAIFMAGTFLLYPRSMGAALLTAILGAYLVGRWCVSRARAA